MTKTCNTCGETKPVIEFYAHARMKDGCSNRCKVCDRLRAIAWSRRKRSEDPHYATNMHLRTLYGFSLQGYRDLLAAQGGKCAACGATEPGGRGRRFHVDHDHATGVIRGLLCHPCNVGLGHFGDDVDRLMAAAAYLLSKRDVLGSVVS